MNDKHAALLRWVGIPSIIYCSLVLIVMMMCAIPDNVDGTDGDTQVAEYNKEADIAGTLLCLMICPILVGLVFLVVYLIAEWSPPTNKPIPIRHNTGNPYALPRIEQLQFTVRFPLFVMLGIAVLFGVTKSGLPSGITLAIVGYMIVVVVSAILCFLLSPAFDPENDCRVASSDRATLNAADIASRVSRTSHKHK
jgi:hypothetical protein